MSQQVTIGQLPKDAKTKKIEIRDAWFGAPWFNPGMTENSEHQFAMPVGTVLGGIYNGMRETTHKDEKDRKTYAKFEDLSGNKFCIKCFGQLEHQLNSIEVGAKIAVEYIGKEYVEKYKRDVHQFALHNIV